MQNEEIKVTMKSHLVSKLRHSQLQANPFASVQSSNIS